MNGTILFHVHVIHQSDITIAKIFNPLNYISCFSFIHWKSILKLTLDCFDSATKAKFRQNGYIYTRTISHQHST